MRSGFPFGGVIDLRFRATCRQVARLLSCGSSERWRSAGIVGPYWLGPPCLPLARMVCQARSASRFSDTRVERGVSKPTTRSTSRSSTPLQSITAATSHRVPVPCLSRFGVLRGAEHRTEAGGDYASGYRGFTRGWDSIIRAPLGRQACQERPENRIVQHLSLAGRLRPRPGAVCHPNLSVWGTVERPVSNFVT